MNELVAGILGAVFGFVFFGGLWLTVKKGLFSKRTGLCFCLSFLVRMGLVGVGIYVAIQCDPMLIFPAAVGFFMMRWVFTRYIRKKDHAVESR